MSTLKNGSRAGPAGLDAVAEAQARVVHNQAGLRAVVNCGRFHLEL